MTEDVDVEAGRVTGCYFLCLRKKTRKIPDTHLINYYIFKVL